MCLAHVVLTCDSLALGGWTSTPKGGFGRGVHCGCCHYRALLGVAVVAALAGGAAAAFGVAHAGVGVGAVSIVTKRGGHDPPVSHVYGLDPLLGMLVQ